MTGWISEKWRVNSYFASVAGDFLRQKLLAQKISFTFETVMSHPSKVELLAEAQRAGYRTYLYFVATEDPAINISASTTASDWAVMTCRRIGL